MDHCLDLRTCHFRRWSCRRRFPSPHFGFLRGYSSARIEKGTCFLLLPSCPDLLHTRSWFVFLRLLAPISRDQPFSTTHPCGCSWHALADTSPFVLSSRRHCFPWPCQKDDDVQNQRRERGTNEACSTFFLKLESSSRDLSNCNKGKDDNNITLK